MNTPALEIARRGGGVIARANTILARFPASAVQLVLRVAVAIPFWNSGLTKWAAWLQLSDGALYLFSEEFKLHVFGQQVAYPLPKLMASAAAVGEILLPILLVLGLGTRFAALGILLMTAVIQLTIPDGWANFHLPWAAMALAVMRYGPGRASVDHLITVRLTRSG